MTGARQVDGVAPAGGDEVNLGGVDVATGPPGPPTHPNDPDDVRVAEGHDGRVGKEQDVGRHVGEIDLRISICKLKVVLRRNICRVKVTLRRNIYKYKYLCFSHRHHISSMTRINKIQCNKLSLDTDI